MPPTDGTPHEILQTARYGETNLLLIGRVERRIRIEEAVRLDEEVRRLGRHDRVLLDVRDVRDGGRVPDDDVLPVDVLGGRRIRVRPSPAAPWNG